MSAGRINSSFVGGYSFSEVNLDISVLLSEIMDGVGDVYLEPWVQFGVIRSSLFFFGLKWGCWMGIFLGG